jgi:AcrR family transcriptional regulator
MSPAERREGRRRRLLEAGLKEFGSVGFGATSIETLCRSAKVTPRYFYEYFSTREALMQAVYDMVAAEVLAEVGVAVREADPRDGEAMVRAGVGSFFEQMVNDPPKARILYIESVGVNPEIEQRRRLVLHQFAGFIAEQSIDAMDDVRLPEGSLDVVTLAFVGGISEIVIDRIFGFITKPTEELAEEMSTILLENITGVVERLGVPTPAEEHAEG